jgi:hypothetical protein
MFVEVAKDVGFEAGAAWKERDGWKSGATPLGKYLTEVDAASFAINMALECLPAVLLKTDHRRAEVVTKSKLALKELQNTRS